MRYVRHEERRNERLVNLGHIAVGLALGVLALLTYRETSRAAVLGMLVAVPFLVSFGVMALLMLRTGASLTWLPYVSVVLEVILVTGILVAVGNHASFKGAAFLGYFVVVALAGLRFSPLLTLVAGLLSLGSYSGFFVWCVATGRCVTAPMSAALAGPFVSSTLLVQQGAFLAMIAGLLVGLAVRSRRGLAEAIEAELGDSRARMGLHRDREALVRLVANELADKTATGDQILDASPEDPAESATYVTFVVRNLDQLRGLLPQDRLVELVQALLSDCLDAILSMGGTLHQLTDRGIVAVFGAGRSRNADEEMAVRAAIRIRDRVAHENETNLGRENAMVVAAIGVDAGGPDAARTSALVAQSAMNLDGTVVATASVYGRIRSMVQASQVEVSGVEPGSRDCYRVDAVVSR